MNVLYLTMNPNRQSTTVPTEGWFRLLPARGLKPVLVSRERGVFDAWASGQGIPAYQNPLPFPDKRRPWKFLRAMLQLRSIAKRHRIELDPLQRTRHLSDRPVFGSHIGSAGRSERAFHHGPRVTANWAFSGRRTPSRMFFVSQGNSEYCHSGLDGIVPAIVAACCTTDWIWPNTAQTIANLRCEFREQHGLKEMSPHRCCVCASPTKAVGTFI